MGTLHCLRQMNASSALYSSSCAPSSDRASVGVQVGNLMRREDSPLDLCWPARAGGRQQESSWSFTSAEPLLYILLWKAVLFWASLSWREQAPFKGCLALRWSLAFLDAHWLAFPSPQLEHREAARKLGKSLVPYLWSKVPNWPPCVPFGLLTFVLNMFGVFSCVSRRNREKYTCSTSPAESLGKGSANTYHVI